MQNPCPVIQGPSPEVIASLLEAVESGGLFSGPLFCWDSARSVFLMAVVEHGVVVHWMLEPAGDQAAAASLKEKYLRAVLAAARSLAEGMDPTARDALREHLRGELSARHDH